jgi:hypothetical protein
MAREHLLRQLYLPDRYERLSAKLGPEVVQILVPPEQDTIDEFERVALAVQTRDEGLLVPMHGDSGVGKTTLLDNLTYFLPQVFTQTLNYQGSISFDELEKEAKEFTYGYPANEKRVFPINVDHRENAPPNDRELADMKRFLRVASLPVRPIIIWPDTNLDNTVEIASRYEKIAGDSPVQLPLIAKGPPRASWVDIARHTLHLANNVESLEYLGVDPANYNPEEFNAIGGFLRNISTDFDNLRFNLQKETRRPISLVIVFPSESQDPGVLTQLTSSTRYGLIDPSALLGVTPQSEVGRWWSGRRGLLTRAVVQLDVHAIFLPPGISVGLLRRYGSPEVQQALSEQGVSSTAITQIVRDLSRSDFGKFLSGIEMKAYEARGTPAQKSVEAFRRVGDLGFIQGRDKILNRAIAAALRECLPRLRIEISKVEVEQQLDFCPLIPDNSIYLVNGVQCIEYHWRNGDFLKSKNRSSTAQYMLKKIRDYVRQLGWTAD